MIDRSNLGTAPFLFSSSARSSSLSAFRSREYKHSLSMELRARSVSSQCLSALENTNIHWNFVPVRVSSHYIICCRVGQLIKMTVQRAREIKPDLKIGVCGEHGGDPRSVRFFSNDAGLTYVSCSPFRVPIARLAAAQSAVEAAKSNGLTP